VYLVHIFYLIERLSTTTRSTPFLSSLLMNDVKVGIPNLRRPDLILCITGYIMNLRKL
jgi:hypothetical protein